MASRPTTPLQVNATREQNLAYVHQMLSELRMVAEQEDQAMLAYLIEMAYLEAGDNLSRMQGRSSRKP